MPPTDGSLTAPGQGPVRSALSRLRRSYDAAPLPVRALIVIAGIVLCVPFAAIVMVALLAFAGLGSLVGVRVLRIAKPAFVRWVVIALLLFSGAKALTQGLGLPFVV